MHKHLESVDRRTFVAWTGAVLATAGSGKIFPADLASATRAASPKNQVDWSLRLIESTLKRQPDPAQFGPWGYTEGLYLFGQYLVYRRNRDRRLLGFITGYLNAHINQQGELNKPIHSLDDVLAANLLIPMYQETQDPRYKLAAEKFRHFFDDYPRTTDGGFWHANAPSRAWQLWLDGNYMALLFLVRYGHAFGDSEYCNREAVHQLLTYHKHLRSTNMGLLYHAYDESGQAAWADSVTHHSAYFWCRAMGWYGMTLVDVLDILPHNSPDRAELLTILRNLIGGLAHYQDRETGLWYQILDQPRLKGNWTETSSSSMFTYIIDISVKRGYVSKRLKDVARRGYQGVLSRLALGDDGLTNLSGICGGTNVGDLAWYLARPRPLNDLHGLGAFLLMNEEWTTSVSSMRV